MPASQNNSSSQLSEKYIQDSFHSYLKSSLTQAKAERLLDADVLASAEGDLMITGPALCLYFAALRCTTNPPSVPLPRLSKSSSQPMELSYENCPAPFISFLRVWANTVPSIQNLIPESQHDLARVICGLPPLLPETHQSRQVVSGIAADLRAVAIEISQRRSFQDRYASDLQAALDAGGDQRDLPGHERRLLSLLRYTNHRPIHLHGPHWNLNFRIHTRHTLHRMATLIYHPNLLDYSPLSLLPDLLSHLPLRLSVEHHLHLQYSPKTRPPSNLFAKHSMPQSADALERQPSLRRLLKRDRTRAYFASVAFAILDVATTSVTPDGAIVGVLGKPLTLEECPKALRPFMLELAGIGHQAKEIEEEDTKTAIDLVQAGKDVPPSRLDRVKKILEEGVGYDQSLSDARDGRRSVEGRGVAFANRINGLSLGMTRLKAFKERQEDVFKCAARYSAGLILTYSALPHAWLSMAIKLSGLGNKPLVLYRMLVTLGFVLIAQNGGLASPLSNVANSTVQSTLQQQLPSPSYQSQRSLWDILWGCLATIFACTWVSVHPNIPDPNDGSFRILLRRLELMLWATLVPELVLFWALRQFMGAYMISRSFRAYGWTMTHAHFLQMGGFRLAARNDSDSDKALHPQEFHDLLQAKKLAFPRITKDEIQDRSKGDQLSKGLAIAQTSWFIIQCISRKVQGLAITQLEIATVALAFFNALMYFFWWNKPFDVRSCVTLYEHSSPLPTPIFVDLSSEHYMSTTATVVYVDSEPTYAEIQSSVSQSVHPLEGPLDHNEIEQQRVSGHEAKLVSTTVPTNPEESSSAGVSIRNENVFAIL
ncbi:hypothetical protein CPB84DRAFT_1753215 [Gymnopilus junonius]|uniref:Uncharacterized protein n=1 Tax=Gymnopilus junonius TaxID=109634 RepID=A0A9P5NAR6_GYMJU|nr:hypothetical protein CPB84DRAFT_1753215 [Gymnopilus junonius]